MSLEGEHFERELSDRLSQVAAGAGPGPSADQITRRIKRRAVLRLTVPAGACALAAGVFLIWLGTRPAVDPDSGESSQQAPLAHLAIEPLPVYPTHQQVETTLRKYFKAVGAVGAIRVDKSPNQRFSYAYRSSTVSARDVEADLEQIFRNFDLVYVSISNGDFRYTLAAGPRLGEV